MNPLLTSKSAKVVVGISSAPHKLSDDDPNAYELTVDKIRVTPERLSFFICEREVSFFLMPPFCGCTITIAQGGEE